MGIDDVPFELDHSLITQMRLHLDRFVYVAIDQNKMNHSLDSLSEKDHSVNMS